MIRQRHGFIFLEIITAEQDVPAKLFDDLPFSERTSLFFTDHHNSRQKSLEFAFVIAVQNDTVSVKRVDITPALNIAFNSFLHIGKSFDLRFLHLKTGITHFAVCFRHFLCFLYQ